MNITFEFQGEKECQFCLWRHLRLPITIALRLIPSVPEFCETLELAVEAGNMAANETIALCYGCYYRFRFTFGLCVCNDCTQDGNSFQYWGGQQMTDIRVWVLPNGERQYGAEYRLAGMMVSLPGYWCAKCDAKFFAHSNNEAQEIHPTCK